MGNHFGEDRVIGSRIVFSLRERGVFYWAFMFLVIALVAAVFGFGGIASTATGMAQILFLVALVLCVVSVLAGFVRRNL
jgi:uncharacterized membrane protein YtjA (UPF0391 family)